jgi:hypothetical protein
LWNFAAVLMGVGLAGEALKSTAISPAQGDILAVVGTLILVILSAGAFLGLRNLPEKLQESEEPEVLQASVVESSSGL